MFLKKFTSPIRKFIVGARTRDQSTEGRIIAERLRELTKPVSVKVPSDTSGAGHERERKEA